jgi:hypothetical protein
MIYGVYYIQLQIYSSIKNDLALWVICRVHPSRRTTWLDIHVGVNGVVHRSVDRSPGTRQHGTSRGGSHLNRGGPTRPCPSCGTADADLSVMYFGHFHCCTPFKTSDQTGELNIEAHQSHIPMHTKTDENLGFHLSQVLCSTSCRRISLPHIFDQFHATTNGLELELVDAHGCVNL